MNICVLIPSFNEEETIGWLVKSIREYGHHVLVIDDGSSDQTTRIARETGAEVVINSDNLGKGASLRKGFELLSRRPYDAVVTMDGDGQHLPEDIPGFVDYYIKKRAGVLVGNRMSKAKGMPLIRWLTNKLMSFVISKMCRQHIPDSQCGFRLINSELLKKMRLRTDNFEIESETLLEARRNGYSIESVPITTVYGGQYSAINPLKDTLRFFRFIFKKR